jgi:hypothetical protein
MLANPGDLNHAYDPRAYMTTTCDSPGSRHRLARMLAPALAILIAGNSLAQPTAPAPAPLSGESPELKADAPDKKLLFSTTFIEAKSADGKQTRTGTAFVFNHDLGTHGGMLFVVTCRHVVDGFASATLSFIQRKDGKPSLGQNCQVPVANLPELVFYNPDPRIDVAVIPLQPVLQRRYANREIPYFQMLGEDLIPNRAAAEALGAFQPVVFAGYPDGMRDETNLLPIARSGFTASAYVVDYQGLPVFLMDGPVAPGSSGSPVVVLDQGSFPTRGGANNAGRLLFLGLLSDAYFQTSNGELRFQPSPSASRAGEPRTSNIGAVIKPGAILNTISEFLKVHPVTAPDDSDRPSRN